MRQPFRSDEVFSALSHLAGAIAAVFGLIVLAGVTRTRLHLNVASQVYGLSLVVSLGASTAYHSFKVQDEDTSWLRKLDHAAIFWLIAGTYTPVCIVYLDGGWRIGILAAQWGVALAGTLIKLVRVQAPRWTTVSLYLAMGWMALIPLPRLLDAMPLSALLLMVGGGVAYSVGALVYALKRPDPWPGIFGFHDIFHVFVLLGAGLHYALVYRAVAG